MLPNTRTEEFCTTQNIFKNSRDGDKEKIMRNKESKITNLSRDQQDFYLDVKHDSSLYCRFHEAVKILATDSGSLNKRLFKSYYYFLSVFGCEHFREPELEDRLEFIKQLMRNPVKCTYYKQVGNGRLHCHWKESRKMAENIFFIYSYILNEHQK